MDVLKKINNTAFGYNQQTGTQSYHYPVFAETDKNKDSDSDYKQSAVRFGEGQYAVPFRLALTSNPDDVFHFPLDPIVVVKGKNDIVKREIAKAVVEGLEIRGTVKELWNQSDWEISVSGVLSSTPEHDVDWYHEQLLKYFTAKEALNVECDVLNNVYKITQVCIESVDFPFTKGVENQSFSFSLVSDDSYDLEVK